MRILVTGGTGFVGAPLVEHLWQAGHDITVLTRSPAVDRAALAYVTSLDALPDDTELDAVINLAGASLADRRWSQAYKRELVASRLDTTRALVALLRRLPRPPEVLLSASAIGYYGRQRGDTMLAEDGRREPGFAHDLCAAWEAEALAAADLGVRVCLLRLGVVLAGDGGALTQMARPFRLGVESWPGTGLQWFSWVHRADVVRAVEFLLLRADLRGPFNVVAPQPVTARQFASALGVHFRTLLRAGVPAPVLRLAVGEMADELLLHGQRVVPAALHDAGFRFQYPGARAALAAIFRGD